MLENDITVENHPFGKLFMHHQQNRQRFYHSHIILLSHFSIGYYCFLSSYDRNKEKLGPFCS